MVYTNSNNDNDTGKVNLLTNNDIERYRSKLNNDNVNKYDKSKNVDYIADELVSKLSSPLSRNFYCKVAWRLPEHIIWSNLESAQKGSSPAKLFTWLCNKDMAK